jgi:hypothetical protein
MEEGITISVLKRIARLAIAMVLTVATAVGCTASTSGPSISDADLLAYAAQQYDKALYRDPPNSLGRLNGVQVVVEYVCSDVCPAYTVRIIHLTVPVGATCADIGGVQKSLTVPMGIGVVQKDFCFPRILVEHWDEYVR